MNITPENRLLAFLTAVAVLGAGVRIVRVERAAAQSVQSPQPALARQMAAADSSAAAQRSGAAHGGLGARRGQDTVRAAARRVSRRDTARIARDSAARANAGVLDRAGYIGKRLDLDVASAAQIDSLPGVTPSMAKRIVADRMMHGPFLNRDGLRRVVGAGPMFIARIDSLITFSGIVVFPKASDTVVARPRSARR